VPSGRTNDASQARRLSAIEVRFGAMETHRNRVRALFPAACAMSAAVQRGLIKLKLLLRMVEKRTDVQEPLIGSA
jgi:hypothetical protein